MEEQKIIIGGMHCAGCKMAIEKALKDLEGVKSAKIDLSDNIATVIYDSSKINIQSIYDTIKSEGYSVIEHSDMSKANLNKYLPLVGLLALGFIIVSSTSLRIPSIATLPMSISYLALFLVGLMTSLHCVGMCGGINLSVTLQNSDNSKPWVSSLLYNLGRVSSYTLLGGILGATGAALSITSSAKAGIAIFAGFFVAIMGMRMMGVFNLLKLNKIIPIQINDSFKAVKPKRIGAYAVGLFNGFMPCGPLQAMQIFALGTGSWKAGALSMFFFSLGTLPLMFSFGFIASRLSKKFNQQLTKLSGAILILLAIISISRGIALLPASGAYEDVLPVKTEKELIGKKATILDGYQEVIIDVSSRRYEDVIVQKGLPIRLIFRATSSTINGCNDGIIIPSLNLQSGLVVGDTTLELPALDEGTINYSCWMGMIKNSIYVVDDLSEY